MAIELVIVFLALSLVLYAVLGGADFGAGLLELALEPGLADDVVEGLQDLELAVGLRLADVDVLGQVHVWLAGNLAARAVEGDARLPSRADLVDVEAAGLFDRGFPQVNTDVGEHHRRAGDAVFLHDAGAN